MELCNPYHCAINYEKGSPCDVIASVQVSDIVVSEFQLQSHYYDIYPWEMYLPMILQASGYIVPLLFF